MSLRLVKKLVIHQLRDGSDRRGPVCDLVMDDIPNTEHAISVGYRTIQRVASLMSENYFWSDRMNQGLTEFSEQFESWIDWYCKSVVTLRHKYWSQDMVDAFLKIMLALADLHKWEVEDRRTSRRKWEFDIDTSEARSEDGGMALITDANIGEGDDADVGLFVRLHSWDESRKHEDFKSLYGKKVRITVEATE